MAEDQPASRDGTPDEPSDENSEETDPALSEYADPEQEVPPESAEPRRYPSTIGGMVYLVALAVSVAAIVVVTQGHWRTGLVWIACAMIVAAIGRLLLPREQAGMLEVRRRSLDVATLAGFGIAILILNATINSR